LEVHEVFGRCGGKVKHKVKLVRVEGEVMTLSVDGVLCSYLIQRSSPLSSQDAAMMRSVMDTQFLEALKSSVLTPVGFWRSLLLKFRGFSGYVLIRIVQSDGKVFEEFLKLGNVSKSFGEIVADYIKNVGVGVDIDKKTKGVVILKSDVDKIRKGAIGV